MSHSALAYAACPMCTRVVHMGQMLHHILSTHKEQDPAYWMRLCNARLALYERVTGAPLEGTETMHGACLVQATAGVADAADSEAMMPDGLSLSTPLSAQDALRPFLPTVSETGAYTCNWCTLRSVAFSSRDAFLLHVAKDHPKLDFDVVESLVPQPHTVLSRAARNEGTDTPAPRAPAAESDVAMSDSWTRQQRGGAGCVGAASNLHAAEGFLDVAYPVRRMPGVRTVKDTNVVTVKPEVHQLGTTVGRVGGKTFDPAPISTGGRRSRAAVLASSTASATAVASDLHFDKDCFPCELCFRVFVSELNLLQHLESKHANPTAFASASDADVERGAPPGTAFASSTAAASPSSVEVFVVCDRCTDRKKVFRSSSALFSHIRFRHPAEDAAYETERMIEEQKQSRVFQCRQCSYRYPDATRLDAHMRDAHGVVGCADESTIRGGRVVAGTAQAHGSGELKTAQPSLFSALPPVTVRTRFWCNVCEKGFANASALYAHTESKHTTIASLYPCPACKREFRDVPSLELHVRLCHKNLSLKDMGLQSSVECPDCLRHFLNYESLHDHAVRHHGKSAIAPVRSFLTPASASTAGDGVGVAAVAAAVPVPGMSADASGSTTPPLAVSAPPKPRKVTRRKKEPSKAATES
ncbi:mitochondrial RNA binding protein 1, putative [Leishmania donovani]|uniref:Mitochondrial RNA binding protein 1, putative n=1 Tax=Leishmania donovani TaxID=5661 RepID=A0A3Q8IEK7_LEIDO|nr:mitochondrial RNA binding protein 1, putative [Leishmania donovani]VDZ46660.1 mitochondrial_RNA_binding_protein_1_putative/GeneDB:LmjF.30.0260 [Leishmania donovani]